MAEDKIRKIAERIWGRRLSVTERILREELKGMMEAAEAGADFVQWCQDGALTGSDRDMFVRRFEKLAQLLKEYGWPWRKS